MDLKRQLSSFLRVPERVTLLFAGRADGTAAPVTPTDPLPVSFAPGATSDPDAARENTLARAADTLSDLRDLGVSTHNHVELLALRAADEDEDGGLRVRHPRVTDIYPPQFLLGGAGQALTVPVGANRALLRVVEGRAAFGLLGAAGSPLVGEGGGLDDVRDVQLAALQVTVEEDGMVRVDYWREA